MGGLWEIISALVIGLVLGLAGRLIAPGKQGIPLWLTALVGMAAAFVGNWLAGVFGVEDTAGIDWIRHAFQVGAAVIGVIVVSGLWRQVKRKEPAND